MHEMCRKFFKSMFLGFIWVSRTFLGHIIFHVHHPFLKLISNNAVCRTAPATQVLLTGRGAFFVTDLPSLMGLPCNFLTKWGSAYNHRFVLVNQSHYSKQTPDGSLHADKLDGVGPVDNRPSTD